MNTAVEAGKLPFLLFTAERMFLRILQGYFNDMTNERKIAARAENLIVQINNAPRLARSRSLP